MLRINNVSSRNLFFPCTYLDFFNMREGKIISLVSVTLKTAYHLYYSLKINHCHL